MKHKIVILHVAKVLLSKFPYITGDICTVKKAAQNKTRMADELLNSFASTKPGSESRVFYNETIEMLILDDMDLERRHNIYSTIVKRLAEGMPIKEICSTLDLGTYGVAVYCDDKGNPLEPKLRSILSNIKESQCQPM